MKIAYPSLRWLCSPSPWSIGVFAGRWEHVTSIVTQRPAQKPPRIESKKIDGVHCSMVCTRAPVQIVPACCFLRKAGPTLTNSDGIRLRSPRGKVHTTTSGSHTWRFRRLAYSTGVVVQRPLTTNDDGDPPQQGHTTTGVREPASEGHHVAGGQPYVVNMAGRPFEGGDVSLPAATNSQGIDRTQPVDSGAVHGDWIPGSQDYHMHPPSQESQHHVGPPHQRHGYMPQMPPYDARASSPYYPSPSAAYGSPESPGSSVPVFHQYSGAPAQGFATGYTAQWDGISNSGAYMSHGTTQPSATHYVGPGGAGGMQMDLPPVTATGGVSHPYNTMPFPSHESYTHMYPVGHTQAGIPGGGTHAVNNLTEPQLFSPPSPDASYGNPHSPPVLATPGGEQRSYPRGALDSGAAGAKVTDSFLRTRPRGHLSAGGSGEERLEQLLAEIRQRLGNRANMYDSALEKDPRALLELACRPDILRRMQHSSLDWWYVLFRWQDRYHAMQLSGEIRRRSAAAAAAANFATEAASTVVNGDPEGLGPEGTTRSRGHERNTVFSFFSPEDEKAFFTFLQMLQQAFAARPLSEEAQTHGRLHDRMRCIRQLARAVSDDHRALGMGAASRKEADSLLWSLAVQEARCAANSIDLLRTKGGMPMLLSILRLAETADRRRRRSATRVLVPVGDGLKDANKAVSPQLDPKIRQNDVIIQNFPGGRELKWEWVSAEETQNIFDKLADAFLSCAQEANIEPCVHAVVGMGTLTEKAFLNEGKWQEVCQGEENLLFYTSVLLKRQLRSDEPRKILTPRAFCNLLVANAIAGISAQQHLGVVVKYLLNTTATHDRAKNLSLDESARLAWAVCALRLYDPATAGSQWPANEAAELLARLLSRIGKLVDGPQAAYILVGDVCFISIASAEDDSRVFCTRRGTFVSFCTLDELLAPTLCVQEALRDSHDCVAPLYPNLTLPEGYADPEIRRKACSAYDQSHLGLGGTIVTVVRGALRSFGGTVKPGPERRLLLIRLRNAGAASEPSGICQQEVSALKGTDKPEVEERLSDGTPSQTSTVVNDAVSKAALAQGTEGTDSIAGATRASSRNAGPQEESDNTSNTQGDPGAGGASTTLPPPANKTSISGSAAAACQGSVSAESLREAEWIEGAILDGYPVAFYSPTLKVLHDVRQCCRLGKQSHVCEAWQRLEICKEKL